jgi:histidine triad (HIT) family protein
MDCVFCKLIKGELPSYKVYEDEDYFAFLDINSLNQGHTMVIPKAHVRWVWDVEDFGGYLETVKKIALGIKKAMATDWVMMEVVGIDIPHAHTHLVPRYQGDGHGGHLDPKKIKKIPEDEMKAIADKIKKAID